MNKTIITQSYEETQKLGFDLAKECKGGEVLALHGDLGSGKTTFIQGFAKGLGIEKNIISPTFIIMRTYAIRESSHASGVTSFYHVDLYRIGDAKEVEDIGLLGLMKDPRHIIAIEWPDKIDNLLPEKRIDIFFEYLDDARRKIMLKG